MRPSPALIAALAAAVLAMPLAVPATAAAQDPTVAAVGDIACSPNSSDFNGGEGSQTACRQKHTSDIAVNGGFSAFLALGDLQYENGEYEHFLASYGPSW